MSDRALVEWLSDGESPDPAAMLPPEVHTPRRSPWLLAVAAGLWLGVAVVAGQWVGTRPPADSASAVPAHAEPVPAAVGPPEAPLAMPSPSLEAEGIAVQAHAVLAVRERVSVAQGPTRRYVDLAVAESVRWHGTVGVVEVLAHLLEGDEAAWTASRVARFGVAVTLVDGHPAVIAGPWPVADQRPEPPAPTWAEEPDPALQGAAREALAAAGYHDVTDLGREEPR